MKKYSPAFMSALMGMSIITHAYADPSKITQEEIERLYIDEVKLPGKTLQCFQAGQEIIHEVGLQEFEESEKRIKAQRLDGSTFEVLSDDKEMVCTVITRKPAE